MEHFSLILCGLFVAGLLIRWVFPTAARVLGWVVLVTSLSLAAFLLYWGFTNMEYGYDGFDALGAIFFALVVGAAGLFFGGALVWGKDA